MSCIVSSQRWPINKDRTSEPHNALMMKTIIVLILAVVVAGTNHTPRCKLLKSLKNHGLKKNEVAEFMCIADYSSRFLPKCSTNDVTHGVLQISAKHWCHDSKHEGPNQCNVECSAFDDETFDDDVKCALEIKKRQGLTAWDVFANNCKNKDLKPYLRGCGGPKGGPKGGPSDGPDGPDDDDDDDNCSYGN
ncbi:lysozyme C-like isoform X2 [Hyperolius riggenbachi]